ncbi:MAG: aldo/keto reductase [Oscillospiraceae bacterium]|jgi:predicted aldo/keto reductase-like oxidoreductase|nr:aldo/keto reductase [Oscillospiraceae bacterium]
MKNYFGAPIKKLGFGFMRLPTLPGKPDTEIDLEKVNEMVDLYMSKGFSYFDTAYVYHGGKSEVAIRECVVKRYPRDKFQVTTKLPLWGPTTVERMKEITAEQLERTGLEFFDLYFLHGLGPDSLAQIDGGAWDYLKSLKANGTAKNIGFSYHGNAAGLKTLLDAHGEDVDIVQLQLNYLDWDSEDVQSKLCYEEVSKRGIGVVVMEPLKGGTLVNFADSVKKVLTDANPNASVASWALRFPIDLDGTVTVLSGMNTIDNVKDNINTAENYPAKLTEADHKVIQTVLEELKKVPTIPCTRCNYCAPNCPQNINIPGILGVVNDYAKFQNLAGAKMNYGRMTGPNPFGPPGVVPAKASDCVNCGTCVEHCPQHIKIPDELKKAVELLEK